MEAKATGQSKVGVLGGRSPLLRLHSDEKLIAATRTGNDAAFEQLCDRYRARLFAFCRHMLASKEDAEDVLQEVFVSAYNAIRADDREINVRPWLYRIARNRCLNHLRKPVPQGQDTMDGFVGAAGVTTAEVAQRRDDLNGLLLDVQKLPETQRTALLMREIDDLSYDQISEAMDTTIPSVKSLLVRARMSLAEASAARALSCDDVRLKLAEVAEGVKKTNPALKRHVRECEECRAYKKMLGKTNTKMAMALSVGPLMIAKKLLAAKVGFIVGGAQAGHGAGAAATGSAAAAGGVAASGGSAASVGVSAMIAKGAATLAVTAIVAGGAVEANKVVHPNKPKQEQAAPAAAGAPAATEIAEPAQTQAVEEPKQAEKDKAATAEGGESTKDETASSDDSTTTTGGTGTGTTDSSGSTGGGSTGGGGTTGGKDVTPTTGSPSTPSSPAAPSSGDVNPTGPGNSAPSGGKPATIE